MNWTPLVTEKTAARINKVENPVGNPNTVVTNQPKNQVVTSDQLQPVTSAMLTAQSLMATAQRNHTGESMSNYKVADGPTPPEGTSAKERVDVTGVGGVDQASNEEASKAQAQVDVTGIGGTGVEGVEPDKTESLPTADAKSDDSGFNKDKTTDDSGHTKTYGDSDGSEKGVTDPVTHDAFPSSSDGVKASRAYHEAVAKAQADYQRARIAYDNGTLEQNEQQGNKPASGGSASKGTEPIDSVATPGYKRVDVFDREGVTPESMSSGPTKTWSGTDGNGVTKQVDPVDSEKMEFGGVPTPDVKLHTGSVKISSIRLADLEVELGLTARDEYYNRLAQIDAEPETQVLAQIESYSKVKTAGLNKLAQQRTAGVRRLPSAFGRATAAPNGFERIASDQMQKEAAPIDNDVMDAALFTR